MSDWKIPFNKPALVGRELGYVRELMELGHVSGDGRYTRKCQVLLQERLGAAKVLLTTSCTDALEMAALLLQIKPGDEVVVPSFTFVSTANAFALWGARPVFADVRPDTFNLDETRLESLLTPRTRAVAVVHYAGVGCNMAAIGPILQRHRVPLVEDNAHGLFGQYRGQYLGTFGALATQSFHETKNFSCGEGGALLINDSRFVERAEIIREKGTDRSKFFRGQVDKYTWVDLGSSHLPSDLLAAFLFAQLEARQQIQAARRQIWETYRCQLRQWSEDQGVRLPIVPPDCSQAYHMFYLLMPTPESRDRLIRYMAQRGIYCVFHYQPLHLSPMGRRYGARPGDCPVAEDISQRIVRLPFYYGLRPLEQARVVREIRQFRVAQRLAAFELRTRKAG